MIGAIPVMFWPGMSIALVLLIASSWLLVRHAGLAVLTALSPLPGFMLAALAGRIAPSIFDYLPGFIAAGFLAGSIAPLAANVPPRQAISQSLRDLWPVCIVFFLVMIPAFLVAGQAVYSMAGEASAVVLTALGASFLPYGEAFIVRINRATEAGMRTLEGLAFITEPRWGTSIGGIALVFSALGFFGAQKGIAIMGASPFRFAAMGIVFLVGAFAITRNVRRTAAASLTMIPVTLLMIALSDRFTFSPAGLLLPLAVAAMPVLLMTASAAGFERNGDSAQTATQRGIERFGASVVVTAAAGAVAMIVPTLLSQTPIVESAALLLGGAAALILQPALTTMLYSLLPKRITLEEAFRKR
jgi:hypothetical protein